MNTYSALQVARSAGISVSSVRGWCKDFADYLSPEANPEPGKVRVFNDDDLSVYVTVATLRKQQLSYDEIREKLESGERAEPLPQPDQPGPETVQDTPGASMATEAYTAALTLYEARTNAVESKVDDLHDRLLDAEKRAAAAEATAVAAAKAEADLRATLEYERLSWWAKRFGNKKA